MDKISVETFEHALIWVAAGIVAGFVAVFVTSYVVAPAEKAVGLAA